MRVDAVHRGARLGPVGGFPVESADPRYQDTASMSTPKDIFETRIAAKTTQAELQKKINAVYRFDLSGPQGGTWIVDFTPANAGVRQADEQAQCSVSLTDEDFLAMLAGKLDATMAFMSGKIKVKGDMMLAMKLGQFF